MKKSRKLFKTYDSLEIILTLKRRWKLFCYTFIVLLVIALPFAHWQLEHINAQIKAQNESNAKVLAQIQAEREGRFQLRKAFLKVHKYNNIVLPDSVIHNILRNSNRLIDAYKKYSSHPHFDIWQINLREFDLNAESIAESQTLNVDSANPLYFHLENIVGFINSSPIATNLQNDANLLQQTLSEKNPFLQRIIEDGFVVLMDGDEAGLLAREASFLGVPINRYYIHLDKHRIAFERGYTLTSAQIISANIQTHGEKIYIFVILACVMVSLFVVFFVDCAVEIRRILKADSAK
ncbi:hypothetical protein [Helicobacter sp. 23-1045]